MVAGTAGSSGIKKSEEKVVEPFGETTVEKPEKEISESQEAEVKKVKQKTAKVSEKKNSESVKSKKPKTEKVEDSRKKYYYVVVNHLEAEGSERENPIPVNDLGDHAHGRAVCYPNTRTILSEVQINILRDAVVKSRLMVPEDSGVFEETDPKKAAEKMFPRFKAGYDRQSGQLVLTKNLPRFAVDVQERCYPE